MKLATLAPDELNQLGTWGSDYSDFRQRIDIRHAGWFWYCKPESKLGPLIHKLMERDAGSPLRYRVW